MSIIVLDTETTGLSSQHGHRIIEIGAVKIVNDVITDEFQSLINAEYPISPQAQAVHGISSSMLKGQPGPEVIFPEFSDFIGTATIIAHNAQFDLRFLTAEFTALGFDLPNRVECTLKLSRSKLSLANYRLETVYQYLGGIMESSIQRHRALDDARMAAFVWLALQRQG